MRELKFRAWDTEARRMVLVDILIFLKDGTHKVMIGKDDLVYNPIVMQYTGLKDKNGKEIYAGDIVVNGLSGTWVVQPLENGSMSLLGICKQYKDKTFDISALNYNRDVIGNIYENKDLLL